ncbi:G protein-regulated inducer of neurite outgrowth 2 [Heterocephalus glaber]|uniref:G protein-regulated inducer of neurite outgrowth 2 n=1 Tax=Heterocephalus glaber TaxID=10181 RepID=G5B7J6_HETGA|nr:G protein-regulated inducer of neurite outgrowth 2 [Heterocephalus glaber]XP_021108074.1 G protein-regulated inducer of neurite outgrowth 2 [Heterocephalus glaber]EHB05257.1 G protein-regulated inducer of neurite outgrowth 2 [Heterocephalus glaber]
MSSSHVKPDSGTPRSPCPQPLSQSSSTLLCEGRRQRAELRKSASSTVWPAQQGEASTGPQAPEEEEHLPKSPAAQAQAPEPRPRATGRWRSSTMGNVSMMGSGDLGHLRVPGTAAVQRSHSDLAHSVQTQGYGGARKASLSCSALSGSSPVHKAQLKPGDVSTQGSPAPAAVEQDLAQEDETSNSAWMLGDSQAWEPPPEQGDTAAINSSPQAEPKATGQPATASCHALPPAALLCSMREVVTSGCCHALPATGILAFPKLVASVSESGLQAQHGVRFHCTAPGLLPGHAHCCAHPWGPTGPATESGCRTKDVWTMTSTSDLTPTLASAQDAGVQAAPVAVCKAVATSPSLAASALHMFPEITLGPSLEEALSPVRDVRWDAEGMTWEVYGASVDPEVLGVAIQKHLEMQLEQLHLVPASKDSLSTDGRRGPLRAVMQSLRCPSCCGCSGAAPE